MNTPSVPSDGDILLATLPTPNGPLHLGHLCAFLRFDAAARLARADGRSTRLCSGVDPYESHIPLAAGRRGLPPEALAREFAPRIRADLSSASIDLDGWLDPLDEEWAETYRRRATKYWNDLRRLGALVQRVERVPVDRATGEPRVASGLSGRCPTCREPMRGFLCETCGDVVRPDELIEPVPDDCPRGWNWGHVRSWFLEFPDPGQLDCTIDESLHSAADRDLVRGYLARRGATFRASHPGRWGLAVPGGGNTGQVIYSYALFPVAAELARESLAARGLLPAGDPRWGKCVGIDNLVPTAIGSQLGLLARGERHFDFVATNRFLSLDGSKFSTSRGHALWVADLVGRHRVPVDALRLYLALHAPEDREADFAVDDFVSFLGERWSGQLLPLVEKVKHRRAALVDRRELGAFGRGALARQRRHLNPASLTLRSAAICAMEWLDAGAVATEEGIDTLAHLLAPLCPDLARALGASAQQVGTSPSRAPGPYPDPGATLALPEGLTAAAMRG